jgi:hypothetical protein
MSTNRRRWSLRLAGLGLGAFAGEQLWRHGHDHVLIAKFGEVEPGRIYRGAWQKPWPMRRLLRGYAIRTVVALAHAPTHALVASERAITSAMRVDWHHVPIVDLRDASGGAGIFASLERAADLIADPRNHPVYFHCHHGINRASMAQIAFRTLHGGWTLEQASDEVAKSFGLVAVNHGPDYRIMSRFYRDRVLPRRAGTSGSTARADRSLAPHS